MISYANNFNGIQTSVTEDFSGVKVSTSVVSSDRFHLSVTGGTTRGNFKDPTPITFLKRKFRGLDYHIKTYGFYASRPSNQTITSRSLQTVTNGTVSLPLDRSELVSPDHARTRANALAKIFDQIRGNPNLAVDLAEFHATKKMLADTGKLSDQFSNFWDSTISSKQYKKRFKGPYGYEATRRRNPEMNQKRLDYITGKWLEYRYGWTPLVNSIYDSLDTLVRHVDNTVPVYKGRSSYAQKSKTITGTGTYSSPRETIERDLSVRSQYALRFKLPSTNQFYDWTSLNPLAIAWELTPLSFVADWVVNVSEVLDLIENYAIYASRFRDGYFTDSSREIVQYRGDGFSQSAIQYWPTGQPKDQTFSRSSKAGMMQELTRKNRQLLVTLPLPISLRLQFKVGANRQLDAAALFHNMVGRKLRFL